MGSKLIII